MATKRKSADVPEGFKEVDNSLSGFWKPTDPGQSLQGIVGNPIETKGADGRPNRFYAVRITNPERTAPIMTGDGKDVEIEAGDLVGVGGAILLSFLAGREGQEVFLMFKGMGPKKRGKNPAKLFATYAREYNEDTGEVIEQ